MARQSAEAASVARIVPGTRPEPPEGFSDEEAAIWRDVVDSKPADWFQPDSLPVLREYVRAAVACDRLAVVVSAVFARGEVPTKELLDMRDKESRRCVSLATKLRLTQQSRYTPDRASREAGKTTTARPWERSAS